MENIQNAKYAISAFFEMTPDLVCIADKEGYFKNVNKAVLDKLGYTPEELFSKPIIQFVHEEDRNLTRQTRQELLNGKALQNFENRYLTKDGGYVWLSWTSIYFGDAEIVFAIAKDVTERKKVDLEVEKKYRKFKSLATRFKKSIEEDRKYLAVELHEELAQLASVMKMDVDWVRINDSDISEKSKSRIEHASIIAELLIQTIRRISFSISPSLLEENGLGATIRWHCKEFSILNGIPCHFSEDFDENEMSLEIKMDLFRICQESLSNVMYHAMAKEVFICISDTGETIDMTIKDDGKGFDPAQVKNPNGLGIMQERADSVNGELVIQSEPEKGTLIQVSIKKAA